MYIILKKQNGNVDEIINMFYGDENNETTINNWIKSYLDKDIETLNANIQSDTNVNRKQISYSIEETQNTNTIIKHYKKIKTGYIYNSSERLNEIVYTLTVLEYDCNKSLSSGITNNLWLNINDEVNNRVLKQLDKESLYQIFIKLQTAIRSKEKWNNHEYVNLLSEIIKNFKKDLYSSIAKRLKRFGKKQSQLNYIRWSDSSKSQEKNKQD
jgi:hypothetical protein